MIASASPIRNWLASVRLSWACLVVGFAGWVSGLVEFWGRYPGHGDRLLVLIGAGWATWHLRLRELPKAPQPALGIMLLLIGSAILPVAWYLQTRVGSRGVLLWWQAAGLLLAATGLILSQHGAVALRASAFPLLFPLFALPIPEVINSPLQYELKDIATTFAATGLKTVGVAVERTGFLLRLPSGDLGVADACSGIESLTALTAWAVLLAHLRGFGFFKGLMLLCLAVPVVLMINAGRVVVTGLLQEAGATALLDGPGHDALGYGALLIGLALTTGLAWLLPTSRSLTSAPISKAQSTEIPSLANWYTSCVLFSGLVACLAAIAIGRTDQVVAQSVVALDEIALTIDGWCGEPQPIPPGVARVLAFDRAVYRVYTDNIGRQAHVWVVHWTAAGSKSYHHPDVCWRLRGFAANERWVEDVRLPDGLSFPATAQMFHRGADRHYLLYWTQDGRRVWNDPVDRPTVPHAWVRELLGSAEPVPRLMVMVGVPTAGSSTRRDMAAFTQRFAGELYRVYPEMVPERRPREVGKIEGRSATGTLPTPSPNRPITRHDAPTRLVIATP